MTNAPLLGLCADPKDCASLKKSTADFLEVNVQTFLVPLETETLFLSHWEAAAKLPCPILCANCFLPASLPCVGENVDGPALLAYADTAFTRANQVGIRCIVFGSGGSRQVPEGFSLGQARGQFVNFLKEIAPLAERLGITIVVEPLNARECNFINTLREGLEIVEACRHDSVGLLADTYHMGFAHEGPDTLREFGRHLRHVHVAEHPSRRFPGADGTSHRACFDALRDSGYTGRISVECVWGNFAGEAALAIANLRRDLASA